ncbi:MAG: NAD(P)-dependent oxidoreductase [Phycisphaerae bacterium]
MSFVVTGAGGFLGREIVRQLRAAGQPVTALVRRNADAERAMAAGAVPFVGDLTNPDSLRGLVHPGNIVIHSAARVAMNGVWRDFETTTIAGTRNLLAVALPERPGRIVYVSSAAVYRTPPPGGALRADHTPAAPRRGNLYGRAKLAAERLVREECDRTGCEWAIARLGFLYGSGNRAFHDTLLTLRRRGRLFLVGDGSNRLAACHVADAANAVILGGSAPAAAGRVYDVASDEPVTQREFVNQTLIALGAPPVGRRLPRALAMAGAAFAEMAGRLIGVPALLSRASVALMGADQAIDASAIREELGWTPEHRFAHGICEIARAAERAGFNRDPLVPNPELIGPTGDRKEAGDANVDILSRSPLPDDRGADESDARAGGARRADAIT